MPTAGPDPKPSNLLLVDDDDVLRLVYATALRRAGYHVVEAGDGEEGWAAFEREQPALILLDVEMPRVNGWQLLARLRASGARQPVLMLTGLSGIEDKVKGLSAGADDYLGKPCDHRELLARVHALMRRGQLALVTPDLLKFGDITVDLTNRTAMRANEAVRLSPTEYAMLDLFTRHPGRLVTRAMMLGEVWGYERPAATRTVDTHIWRLRGKIGDGESGGRWIQTVPAGDGYRMVCD